MKTTAKFFATAATVIVLGFSLASPASAQVDVFTNESEFMTATGADEIPIPDAATAFPAQPDNNCGAPVSGSEISRGDLTASAQIVLDLSGTDNLTVTQDLTAPSNSARGLCIFDSGHVRSPANTDPSVMIANTIIGNGEDDYLLEFDSPVHAVGLRLLTNSTASEEITLFDGLGGSLATVPDTDLATDGNERQFVGFKSFTPIGSILVNTTNGHSQNEGIDLIKVAADYLVNINVHPGSDPNPLNLSSGGSTPVAIFGTADFDVTLIDISSLVFADSGVKTVGKSAKELCNVEDIGSFDTAFFDNLDPTLDGYDDLVCHFVTADIDLTLGENLLVELMGDLTDGGSIIGTDVVKVVKE